MANLVSTVKFPVNVKYNGEEMVVSPRETIKNIDSSKLPGVLPRGLALVNK